MWIRLVSGAACQCMEFVVWNAMRYMSVLTGCVCCICMVGKYGIVLLSESQFVSGSVGICLG